MSNDLDSKEKRPQILALATMDAVPVDAMAMANAVLRMLRRINRVGDLHSKELERLSGITTPQLIALRAIQELGEVTAGRIAEHVSLSQVQGIGVLGGDLQVQGPGAVRNVQVLAHPRLEAPARGLRQGPSGIRADPLLRQSRPATRPPHRRPPYCAIEPM